MSSLSRELVFLILQFLNEEKFKETEHKLEQESAFYFNKKYFEEKLLAGEWDEVENYLSGFCKVDDNRYSMKIFFEIRKQRYLEALDGENKGKAVDILVNDLKVFQQFNEDLFKEITQLLALKNFRENEQLCKYGDTKTARGMMLIELKKLIEANPVFRDKLVFPSLKSSRLRTLINQSLNWQHQLCKNPRPSPDIKTLFIDHTCNGQNGNLAPATVNLPTTVVPRHVDYNLGGHGPLQPTTATPNSGVMAGWMVNAVGSSSVQAAVATASSLPLPYNQVSNLKRPTPPSTLAMVECHNVEHQPLKRLRPVQSIDEVTDPTARQQKAWSLDDLPRILAFTLHQGSTVTSLDFHPFNQTLLLVGTNNGEITLWKAGIREKLHSKPFKIWNMNARTLIFQTCVAAANDPQFSVNRVVWSPDGTFCGVAFSRNLIQLYAYVSPNNLHPHLEIDAHVGNVNDITFAFPNNQLCVITCGDDKLVKVWDMTGKRLFNFEGHEAPVYSVCAHKKDHVQFIFSTSLDGKIKAWLYDNLGSRVDYCAPGHWCTTMLYSADGRRLFSCGTSKDGDSFLVEWNESEGAIRRTYSGLRKKSGGVVQFDTARNHFLAVGEDNKIKFWDMDNVNLLAHTDAGGGLPNFPRLRFNKEGNLLAVTTANNGVKILANSSGMRSLKTVEAPHFEALRSPVEATTKKIAASAVASAAPGCFAANVIPESSVANVAPGSSVVNSAHASFALDVAHVSSAANVSHVSSAPNVAHVWPSIIVNGVDSTTRSMKMQKILDDANNKTNQWHLTEIVDPAQCRMVTMPDSPNAFDKVARLLYMHSGTGLLALGSNGIQEFWRWPRNDNNQSGKATTQITPPMLRSINNSGMKNDTTGVNLEEAIPCIALSKNDSFVMSSVGGKCSLFSMMTFRVITTFMPPPPKPSFLAFHPRDNNTIVVGMEDSTIHIYNVRLDEVKSILKGHEDRISSLAFSNDLNVMVSSNVNAKLFFWILDTWEMRNSIVLELPADKTPPTGDTQVQFNLDQVRLLVTHETQLAIYDASTYKRIRQWIPHDTLSAPISCATYSSNSGLIFASFCDGNIGVFDGDTLRLRCRIAPSAYMLPTQGLNRGQCVHPLVIVAHPNERHQFAIGLTNGSVKVIEPLESEEKWGSTPQVENHVPNGTPAAGSSAAARNNVPESGSNLIVL